MCQTTTTAKNRSPVFLRGRREAEYKERRAADRARNIKAYRGGDSESDSESSEEAAALVMIFFSTQPSLSSPPLYRS